MLTSETNELKLAKPRGRTPPQDRRGLQADSVDSKQVLTGRSMPRPIAVLLAAVIGTSSYVVVEPAPTDILFVFLFLVVLWFRSVRMPFDLNPVLSLSLLAFVLGHLGAMFASVDIVRAIFYTTVTLYLLLLWYTIVTLIENYGTAAVSLMRSAFLFAAAIAVGIGLLVHFFPDIASLLALDISLRPRIQAGFKDPNVYAPFVCAAFMLVLNHLVTRRVSLLSVALLCLYAVGILSAFSRGGYANLIVSLAVFVALHVVFVGQRQWLVRGIVIFVVIALVVTPILLFYIESMGLEKFFLDRLQLQSYDRSRFSVHIVALLSFGSNPIGIGPGQSEILLPLSTHNVFLRVATETGILGIIGWLVFLFTSLWICFEGVVRRGPFRDTYAVCLAILGGILVNSMVIDSLHWRHFFLFLAVPIGLRRYELGAARAARRAVALSADRAQAQRL